MDGPMLGLRPELWSGKLFSGGWAAAQGGTIAVTEPATGISLGEVGQADPSDVRQAATRAKAAQAGWASFPIAARAPIFRKAAQFLESSADAAKEWIVRETGSVPVKAEVELKLAVGELHEAAAMVTQPRGLVLPSEHGVTSLARRLPHGVVGVISPFNFPMILSMRAVAPALAVGNAVLLKPDPRTPVTGGLIIARALEEAGLPEGLLHVLPGGAATGEALVTDPDVAMISFTGSTGIGRRVGALAGERLKKVSLELGGKNSLIILDDADLDLAVSNTAWGAFLHQGQICMATGRVLVPASLAATFIEKLAETAERLPVGDPFREQVALGPLIDRSQADRALDIVKESLAAGAKLRAGGTSNGTFFRPTVLDQVAPGMPAFEQEIFAPVAPITIYRGEEELIRLANMSDYGLSAGIITGSSARGLELAAQLKVGICHVNDQTVADEPYAPFGGTGASGNGASHGGPANWDAFTHWQWLTARHAPPRYPF
jgi:benzaldehyde dehydrogenase (NAD)